MPGNDWEPKYDNLYCGLRYRWFIKVIPNDSEDIFGYKNLQFKSLKVYEPGQLLNYIEFKKITKKNKNDWFHPNSCLDENGNILSENKLKYEIAKKAAESGLVPLYA